MQLAYVWVGVSRIDRFNRGSDGGRLVPLSPPTPERRDRKGTKMPSNAALAAELKAVRAERDELRRKLDRIADIMRTALQGIRRPSPPGLVRPVGLPRSTASRPKARRTRRE
jgi:hypothetical protein